MTLLARRLAWQKAERDTSRAIDLRAYILATFTANPLAPYLASALMADGFCPAVEIGPFDQIRQELLIGGSAAAADVVVIWPRLEDLWAGGPSPLLDGDGADAHDTIVSIGELCVDRAAVWGATIVVVLPAVPDVRPLGVGDAANPFGVAATAAATRSALRSVVAGQPGILVVDADDLVRTLGVAHAIDHRRFAAASIPYTEEAFALAGERIAALVRLDRRGARKVAVVDADNTLWGGVVGEDGAGGVDLADQVPA